MKFVFAHMNQETHTFLPEPSKLTDFNPKGDRGPFEDAEALAVSRAVNGGVAAYIDIAERIGAEYTVPLSAFAIPLGSAEDAAFDYMCDKIVAAVKEGCDAVMLDLHGSMAAQSYPDAEGELLKRIRAVAPDMPIAVALDFHCTMTDAIVDNSTVISIYRTTPHIDMYETAQRAGEMLLKSMNGEVEPVMVARRIPLMGSLECMGNNDQPMKSILDELKQIEAEDEDILVAGLSGGHPFTDVGPGGMTAVMVTNNRPDKGIAAAERLLGLGWEHREDLIYKAAPIEETLAYAKSLSEGPIILADCGDNMTSGGLASDMTVLKTVLEMGFEDLIAGPFHCPISSKILFEAGVGSEVTVEVGGRQDVPLMNYKTDPLKLTGVVTAVTEAPITLVGPMATGMQFGIGRSAVLSIGSVDIFVTEQRMEGIEPGVFRHVGVDPAKKKYTLIKSRQHYKAAYGPMAKEMMWVCGPGPVNPNFQVLPFVHVDRPMFPLDEDARFEVTKLSAH
ncbi:M81 family metallopeptidase [Ferrimonas pelagia]|uniref:Microcystinase C n=1 Tax=Ferrimonas pelagia TaxID=1177826 RepID=A0ABP9F1J2_9GAMM